MSADLKKGLSSFLERFANLPGPALIAAGVVVTALAGAGGYYAYRTYDYVQHDNEFCLSCHLMVEPFERFARSAHRGLGCKACHQPTLVERSTMALTQIVENPEEIGVHAEVPNDRCADCHIEGDPEKWALVANSAGHKVHLESDDPTLDGLQCVECHSTGVHEFTAADETCGQSGCHEDNQILLAGMSNLTLHCAACHGFSTPVPEGSGGGVLDAALSPDREECLSCHAMRTLVEMPEPDPHEGVCAACHNPHTQQTPADAVESCTASGCHTDTHADTPMHQELEPGALENCMGCHDAHDFSLDGADCLHCHEDILDDVGRTFRVGSADGYWWSHLDRPLNVVGTGVGAPAVAVQEGPVFRHGEHRDVSCTECHATEGGHGRITVTSLADCRSCHHVEESARSCTSCHEGAEAPPAEVREVTRTPAFSVGEPGPRNLPFAHGDHEEEECATCHTDGLELSAASVDCASCHEEHHEADNACVQCHSEAPESAHPRADVHLTCGGSGCHQEPAFEPAPRTRSACLACHQDQQDHEVGRVCAECHVLPGGRS